MGHLHDQRSLSGAEMIWLLFLLLPLCCSGQQNSFADLAFMEPPAESATPTPPSCTNNVTWMPATSTVDWYETNGGGNHYSVAMAEFQTNCTYKIGRVDFLGSVGNYITNIANLYWLTNCESLIIQTEIGLENVDVAGMFNCTNFSINYNPDLGVMRVFDDLPDGSTGIDSAYNFNASQNATLGQLERIDEASFTNIHLFAINNCSFNDEQQTNNACVIWNFIDTYNLLNGTYATEANAETIADPSCIWAMTNKNWTISY